MAALLIAPGASYHLAGWGWALEAVVTPCPPNLFPSWGDFLFLQVSLRDCHNVSVFLAPSVVGLGFDDSMGRPGHPQCRHWTWRSC